MLQKTIQMIRRCQSGGGHFVCSVVIFTLSKSFGRLLDEIITIMIVNYLIMRKSVKLIFAYENMKKQDKYGTRNLCRVIFHPHDNFMIDR